MCDVGCAWLLQVGLIDADHLSDQDNLSAAFQTYRMVRTTSKTGIAGQKDAYGCFEFG